MCEGAIGLYGERGLETTRWATDGPESDRFKAQKQCILYYFILFQKKKMTE